MQKSFKNDQQNHKDMKQPKKGKILIQIPRFSTPQNGIFFCFWTRMFGHFKNSQRNHGN
jgi:hypothetical protein